MVGPPDLWHRLGRKQGKCLSSAEPQCAFMRFLVCNISIKHFFNYIFQNLRLSFYFILAVIVVGILMMVTVDTERGQKESFTFSQNEKSTNNETLTEPSLKTEA